MANPSLMDLIMRSIVDINKAETDNLPIIIPPEAKSPPEDYISSGAEGIANIFDPFENVEQLEIMLRENKVIIEHCGWDFHGDIWFAEGKFYCFIMQYRKYQETLMADTLRDLITLTNDKCGWN